MSAKYQLLIDESGEAGISRVRSGSVGGASPYMTLGGALIRSSDITSVSTLIEEIRSKIKKKTLHCSEMNHEQKVYYSREISKQRLRLFGVISHKETLGTYKTDIEACSKMYYNKCAQYMLERVGMFMKDRGIPKEELDIVFEEANCDYDGLRNLIRKCQRNPIHPNTRMLRFIDADRISCKPKKDEPLLQIADLVAHALYKCIDKQPKNFGIPEARYLKELESRFYGNSETNLVINSGLYCVHSIDDLKLDTDIKELFKILASVPVKK